MLSPVLGYKCNLLTQPRLGYCGYLCRYNVIPFYTCNICDLGPFKNIFTLTCLKQMNHLFDQPTKLFRKQREYFNYYGETDKNERAYVLNSKS